jgi:UDP-N-acetylmuramoyl-tripeptide--D-alanyl-D-alanine ligase
LVDPTAQHDTATAPYGAPLILDDRDARCSDADFIAKARHHRELLSKVVVIAVTGSCGKTSTKDLIAAILATRFRGSKSEDTKNCGLDIGATVLAASPDDDFLVQELGAWGPGTLDAGIEFIHPHIAVVTNLRHDHYSTLHGPRGAQAEKGKLVASLPATGVAVLNWDDPLVRELSAWTAARTVSFGRDPSADLCATDVSSAWPEPLRFTVSHGGHSAPVRTGLFGEQLLGSALAALSVGLLFGLTLDECAAAVSLVAPTHRRMSPVSHPDGVTFIRDDWKAPADSIPEVLAFMSRANATRKVVVFGHLSDFPGRSRTTYDQVAWQSLTVADAVIFIGDRAVQLWGEQRSSSPEDQETARQRITHAANRDDMDDNDNNPPGQFFAFRTVQDADAFLHEYVTAGDLVLLKGSGPADHLERLVLHREQPVGCWLHNCGRLTPCTMCDRLSIPSTPDGRQP